MQAAHITLYIIFYEASYFDVSFWPSIATLNLFLCHSKYYKIAG